MAGRDKIAGLVLLVLCLGMLLAVPGFPGVCLAALPLGLLLVLPLSRRERVAPGTPRERLVRQLQLAYSGERAAALAYGGHSRSVRDPEERERIAAIEAEEHHHRRLVGDLLQQLGAGPAPAREWRAECVGRILSLGCHVSPWFFPMYGAGRLERGNVKEYEDVATLAVEAGHPLFVPCLLEMAETEWEHEAYFRSRVLGRAWLRLFPLWKSLPPKETIRSRYSPP